MELIHAKIIIIIIEELRDYVVYIYNEWEKVISDIKNQSSIIDYLISKLFYSFLNILFSVIKNSTSV